MKEKIPCIECTVQLWEYIKPYLKKWEYSIYNVIDFNNFPLLVINSNDYLGDVTNYNVLSKKSMIENQ